MIAEIVNIIAGLVLAMGILPSVPAVGKSLEKVAKWLGRFQTIIGIIAFLLGFLGLGEFSFNPLFYEKEIFGLGLKLAFV